MCGSIKARQECMRNRTFNVELWKLGKLVREQDLGKLQCALHCMIGWCLSTLQCFEHILHIPPSIAAIPRSLCTVPSLSPSPFPLFLLIPHALHSPCPLYLYLDMSHASFSLPDCLPVLASATYLVSVSNMWVFLTALTALTAMTEPRTLWWSITCDPFHRRRVELHAHLVVAIIRFVLFLRLVALYITPWTLATPASDFLYFACGM